LGAHGEPRHHSKVLDAAIYGTEGEDLNELVLTTAIADLHGRDGVVQKVLTHRRHSSYCSRATGAGRGSKRRMWITEKDRTVLEFMEKIWDGSAVTRRHMGSGLRVSSSLGAVVHDRSKTVGGSGDGKTESEVAA
jgi:hypothetical protein